MNEGWVYFAQDRDRIKIGWTTSGVGQRMNSLRTALPTVEVVHVIRTDDKRLEKELHRLFKDYNVGGEWFALPDNWRSMLPEKNRERISRVDAAGYGSWDNQSLVGSWFHSFDDEGRRHWQGTVIADVGVGFVLVQTYSWLDGGLSTQHVVAIDLMKLWHFYDTNADMLFEGQYYRKPEVRLPEEPATGEQVAL